MPSSLMLHSALQISETVTSKTVQNMQDTVVVEREVEGNLNRKYCRKWSSEGSELRELCSGYLQIKSTKRFGTNWSSEMCIRISNIANPFFCSISHSQTNLWLSTIVRSPHNSSERLFTSACLENAIFNVQYSASNLVLASDTVH